jgi:hypothetical protein
MNYPHDQESDLATPKRLIGQKKKIIIIIKHGLGLGGGQTTPKGLRVVSFTPTTDMEVAELPPWP